MKFKIMTWRSLALLAIGTWTCLAASCQTVNAPSRGQEWGLLSELQSLRARPDDKVLEGLFSELGSTVLQTGDARKIDAVMPGQSQVDSVVIIRDVTSNNVRRILISQKNGLGSGRCITVSEVSQRLGLFIQPGEPTPVFATEGQRKLAVARDDAVEVRAVAETPNSECLGKITFDYR